MGHFSIEDILSPEAIALLESNAESEEPEQVVVHPSDAEDVADKYNRLREIQMQLGRLVTEFEQKRSELLAKYNEVEEQMTEDLRELEAEYGIPHGNGYTLELDDQPAFHREDPGDGKAQTFDTSQS